MAVRPGRLATPNEKLFTTQRKIKKIMVGVTLRHRRSTNCIRKQSRVTSIIRNVRESKHSRVGHVASRSDNRWTIRVTEWMPRRHKRPQGRRRTWWCDGLIRYIGPSWSHIVKDRKLWTACRYGFLLRGREKHSDRLNHLNTGKWVFSVC